MEYAPVTVVETRSFRRGAARLLAEIEVQELVDFLSLNPVSGVLIRDTGGLRKLRWAAGGKGKRGGARVIYYFHSQELPLYLLQIFGKSDKLDLDESERKELKFLVRQLVDEWNRRNG